MSILTVGAGEPHSADGEKYPLRTYLSSKPFKGVCNKGPGAQVSSGPASVIIFPCCVTNECRMMWVILSVTFLMLFKIMIQKNTADKTVHRRVHLGFLSVWVHVLQFDIWFCQAQVTIQLSKSHKRNISKSAKSVQTWFYLHTVIWYNIGVLKLLMSLFAEQSCSYT